MKTLFIFLFSLSALANCDVFIPEKEFNYYGYVIGFDFTQMLEKKNYREVNDPSAKTQILIQGIEQEGRLHRAVGKIEFRSSSRTITAAESVLCFTQLCGLSDYGRAFQKSYKKLTADLPVCAAD